MATTLPERTGDDCPLPGDILTSVFQLLDTPSRICFRAVCRSWRAAGDAAYDPCRATRMPPPWVVIPDDIGCSSRSFTLISIPTQQGFRLALQGGASMRFVGSNGGWLAGAHIDADGAVRVSLINPLTNARVDFPNHSGRFVPGHERNDYEVERALAAAVHKVAFAPSPTAQSFSVAVVGMTHPCAPASFGIMFGREGGWCGYALIRDIDERTSRYYSAPHVDVAYHDGKFYYVTETCSRVWVVDMAESRPSPVPLVTLPHPVSGHRTFHLGFSGDGALHVVSSKDRKYECCNIDMFVHRYDGPMIGPSASEWASATRLRGQCFLIGDLNQTMCVAADGNSDDDGDGGGAWMLPDSVYFTVIPFICSHLNLRYREDVPNGINGVWCFNLATGYIRRPKYFRKVRYRPPLEFWQPPWSKHKDDILEEEAEKRLKSGLDWSKAIWLMPSMR